VVFCGAFIAMLALANTLIGRQNYPDYGSWTGIRPLEEKLHSLEVASARHSPDALVLGSSIADFGFDAELFSSLISQQRGVEYQAFNFSTGGTELETMPNLYRLARTVSAPRELLLVVPDEVFRPLAAPPGSPDYTMQRAPVGPALRFPFVLPLAQRLWAFPLLKDAAAVRDQLAYGHAVHRPAQGSDLYPMDTFGDTLSFSYQASRQEIEVQRQWIEDLRLASAPVLVPIGTEQDPAPLDRRLAHFFGPSDVDAIFELRTLAQADGVELTVIAHASAAAYYPEPIADPVYTLSRRQFHTTLAEALGARLIDAAEDFSVPEYGITDPVHLNRFGARLFTARVAARVLDAPEVARVEPRLPDSAHAKLGSTPDDPTVNAFSSLLRRPAGDGAHTLRLRFMANQSVPELPAGPLWIAARLPNGQDLTVPAARRPDGSMDATFDDLPRGDYLLLVRLLQQASGGGLAALNQPLAEYTWVAAP
jgi:hypothetical protein